MTCTCDLEPAFMRDPDPIDDPKHVAVFDAECETIAVATSVAHAELLCAALTEYTTDDLKVCVEHHGKDKDEVARDHEAELERLSASKDVILLQLTKQRDTAEMFKQEQAEHRQAKAALNMVATDYENVWAWQGDGGNFTESLSCPVVMSADTLREMLDATRSLVAAVEAQAFLCTMHSCGSTDVVAAKDATANALAKAKKVLDV